MLGRELHEVDETWRLDQDADGDRGKLERMEYVRREPDPPIGGRSSSYRPRLACSSGPESTPRWPASRARSPSAWGRSGTARPRTPSSRSPSPCAPGGPRDAVEAALTVAGEAEALGHLGRMSSPPCEQRCRCIGAPPPAGNAGQAEAANGVGNVRCAGQLMAMRLEAEQHAD